MAEQNAKKTSGIEGRMSVDFSKCREECSVGAPADADVYQNVRLTLSSQTENGAPT
jgi:hypothetical protein